MALENPAHPIGPVTAVTGGITRLAAGVLFGKDDRVGSAILECPRDLGTAVPNGFVVFRGGRRKDRETVVIVRESAEDQEIACIGGVAGAPIVAGAIVFYAGNACPEAGIAGASVGWNIGTADPRIGTGADIHGTPGWPKNSDVNGGGFVRYGRRHQGKG